MKTIGNLLKKRRQQLGISLGDVERDLRIRRKYLEGLEENNFDLFPSVNYIKGFLQNYCRFLGLDEGKVLAIFRRQFNAEEELKLVYPGASVPLDEPLFKITPQRAALAAIIVILSGFFLYLFSQLRLLTEPPPLIILDLAENVVVESPVWLLKGKTSPSARILINGKAVHVRENGEFEQKVNLEEGVNELTIEAISSNDKKTTEVRSIRYQPR